METLFFCPLWGSEHLPFGQFSAKVKEAGYDGVEMSLPQEDDQREDILKVLGDNDLKLIAQHWQTHDVDLMTHRSQYEGHLRNLAEAGPLMINSHTGKDFFSLEQNVELLELAASISKETGVKIIHETHRGRFSFAAHITKRFFQEMSDLRIALDVSHWFNVAESFLEDQAEAVDLAIAHTEHIHCRVGFAEGPQIPDPRAPEWGATIDRHLEIWDKIISRARSEGRDHFTVTAEFGPPPYMPIQPLTRTPISDQWAVNVYMKDLLSQRYN